MDFRSDKKPPLSRRAIWLAAALALCGLSLCLYRLAASESCITMPRSSATFHTVKRGVFSDTLVTRAIAVPNESVIISTERGGKVVEINKASSDFIKKGETIARLENYDFVLQATSRISDAIEQINNLRNTRMLLERDSRDTKMELQKSHYNLLRLAKAIKRNKKLYERSVIDKATFENLLDEQEHWQKTSAILAEHRARQDQLLPYQLNEIDQSINRLGKLVNLIKAGLKQLVITSPIEGTLSSLDLKIGQQIKPGERVAIVDNLHSYHFEAAFSEYYLDKIKPHSEVMAESGGVEIPLAIESVSTAVDNGKFKAKLALAQPRQITLKRGQSIDLRVSLGEARDALLAPSKAIFFHNGQAQVYVYDEHQQRAVKTPVKIRRQGVAQAEVVDGVSEGQQVVAFADNLFNKAQIIEFE